MTDVVKGTLTIGEVCALTGLTAPTVRFYEQEGLFFAPVRRDSAGRRVFTADEVEWLRVCMRLRSSGMPLPEIRQYAQLVLAGDGNEEQRLDLLRRHETRVRQQVTELQEALAVIRGKVDVYAARLAAGTAKEMWDHVAECGPTTE